MPDQEAPKVEETENQTDARGAEETVEETPVEKDPALNCPNCGGEGLIQQNNSICTVCKGTGKVQ